MSQEKEKQIKRAMKDFVQKEPRLTMNDVQIIVGIERAIARMLARQELAEHLIFKGGFVLLKNYQSSRFTRDADALAVAISQENLEAQVKIALSTDLDDGFWYGDIQLQQLPEQGEYGAYRFDCAYQIGEPDPKKIHKLSRIHIDIGFSDRLPSIPQDQIMPSLLDHEAPVSWKIYPLEFIVAEKVQTLFDRGSANSRSKDVFDLIYLLPLCTDSKKLASAIKTTFNNRNTKIPSSFAKEASLFNKTILSNGWPGVKILKDKPDFETAWGILMEQLKNLDD